MKLRRLAVAVVVACLLAPVVRLAARQQPKSRVPLPANLAGALNGVKYRIRVPAEWKGTLLVYAHASRPSAVPALAEPEIAPPPFPAPDTPFENDLLDRGYALAGAEFVDGLGIEATRALTTFFDAEIAKPARVVVWGNSGGGFAAAALVQRFPGVFAGGIANCAPVAGMAKAADASLRFGLAYDAAFGWPSEAWGPVEDVRDDLSLVKDVMPLVKMPGPPERRAGWEFIRLMMKSPEEAFWGADPQFKVPFYGMQMWRATEVRARMERLSGGNVAQNVGQVYALTVDEKAYLKGLGLDADSLLARMNARARITAMPAARSALEAQRVDGRLSRPLLTMHSMFDGLVIAANETVFRADVQAAGAGANLVQVFTTLPGHCSFSRQQLLAALAAMESWLDTGRQPGASSFPASAGFARDFQPPAWPF